MSKPKSPRRPFDLVVCERVMAGEWHQVTDSERRYIVDVMTRQGSSALEISQVLQIERRSVERIKATAVVDEPASTVDSVKWPGRKRDELALWAEQEATRLITDVRDIDSRDIWIRLSHLPRVELQSLVIGLAAMVPDDRNRDEMLAWCNSLEAV